MSQSKSFFLFSINLRRDLYQTVAHRLIGLLSEVAQKLEECGEALGSSRRRLYKFLHEKSCGKEPCLLRRADNSDKQLRQKADGLEDRGSRHENNVL